MNKKLIISLSIIGVVAAAAIGGTIAYFNDVETSTGNIFVAGTMDLKVDHTRQTYNDVDCKTCSVIVYSDTSDKVMSTVNGTDPGPFPHNAVLVTVINPAWTANIPGANWIWSQDPTPLSEYGIDTFYTFEKTFDWYGPITGATLQLSIGADNSYEIYLNNNWVAGDNTEQNYNAAGQDTITGAPISNQIVQGVNTLKFVVKNWLRPQGQNWANPGGLLYKLAIDGQCGDDYFKAHCQLWGLKDLANETFYNFNDVKPGDRGVNVISLHAYDNDAYACLITHDIVDVEDTVVDPEITAGDDIASIIGELSGYIKLFAWEDDGDGDYEGETVIVGPNADFDTRIGEISLTESNTKYIGVAWCAGTQTVVGNVISCDGSSMGDIAQSDIMTASLTAYIEQQRNNSGFDCANVILP